LPSGGSDSRGLPELEDEVRDVAALYGRATPLAAAPSTLAGLRTAAAGTGVVHIAGHTERQPGGGEQALLFGTSGKIERVSWKAVVASPAPYRGVVVLAACETLRPPPSTATRALSLGAAFSVAGAAGVAGTLSPIGDRDARLLFRALHRQLAAGVLLADALRAVQEEAIVSEKANGGSHAWRAVASWTRRIPAPTRRKE
jgi:CHAT domain-containing protein